MPCDPRRDFAPAELSILCRSQASAPPMQSLPNGRSPLQQHMRNLFPGGFKLFEIKVPTLVPQLNFDEVLRSEDALDAVDVVVSKWAGIVVLNVGEAIGGRLYEAACVSQPKFWGLVGLWIVII
ncbi:hypothetical protein AAC387_Pa07g2476 [Persea americana]